MGSAWRGVFLCGHCNADLLDMSGCDGWFHEICVKAISLREQLHTPPLPCSTGGLAGVDRQLSAPSSQHALNWLFNCLQPGKSRHVVRTGLRHRVVILTSIKSLKRSEIQLNIERDMNCCSKVVSININATRIY